METQFGLAHIWQQGDWVTKFVALFLLGMSVASWLVIIIKSLNLMRYKKLALESKRFWHENQFETALGKLSNTGDNPFKQLAQEGLSATQHQRHNAAHLHASFDTSDWLTRSLGNCIDIFTGKLQSGLALLASIGSTAPFVGLFGTVWGIYHALLAIGLSGQAGLDKVAGPIGEALVMTALGLAVAIPAVLGYNALVRGNKVVLAQINRFAHDLHAYFITGSRVDRAQAAAKKPATPQA